MIKLPRGTQDILPEAWPLWRHVIEAATFTAEEAGYARIETPMFERTSLFTHATGEHTDVNREMYTFEDRGGDQLSLRPEGTASVFRAYFEHGMKVLPQPVKLYYIGSMFRYERPQAGRFREHHQFGCEAIGSEDALLDASLVGLQGRFYIAAGIPKLRVQVNSIGDGVCRPAYIRELVAYLRKHESELCGQCRDRIERNPLRVLDCKVASCQPVLNAAPRMLDHLCDPCRDHWQRFRKGIEAMGIAAEVNARLVRGLDYYTRTVWEFLPDQPGGAQSVLGGGGRYDALGEAVGVSAVPGVGFSTGIERVLLNLGHAICSGLESGHQSVFVVHHGHVAEVRALAVASQLLHAHVATDMVFGDRSVAAQMKQADRRQAQLAIVIGEDELARDSVLIKTLATGEQTDVPVKGIVETVVRLLNDEKESAK